MTTAHSIQLCANCSIGLQNKEPDPSRKGKQGNNENNKNNVSNENRIFVVLKQCFFGSRFTPQGEFQTTTKTVCLTKATLGSTLDGWAYQGHPKDETTPNPPTNIVVFGGFDSSTMLILRGWNSQAHKDFLGILPENLTQAMLVGTMLVGKLGVINCSFMAGAIQHMLRTVQGPELARLIHMHICCMYCVHMYTCMYISLSLSLSL